MMGMGKGLKFLSAFKEPEPEEMRGPHSQRGQSDYEKEEVDGSREATPSLGSLIARMQAVSKQQEGYFIYLRQNPADPRNPYDLIPFDPADSGGGHSGSGLRAESRAAKNLHVLEDFKAQRARQILGQRRPESRAEGRDSQAESQQQAPTTYFTLSKKGITTFVNNEPREFIRIEDWLAERAQFTQISQKKFFANFRTWKVLRMWRSNILAARRELVTASLRARLYIADPVFGKILLQHRANCKDLEKLRVLDLQQVSRDSVSIIDF
jgi:hypothetical protein